MVMVQRRGVWLVMAALLMGFCNIAPLYGLELSLVSGFYQRESGKLNGSDNGGKSAITFGGRLMDKLSKDMAWFGEAVLAMKTYDAPANGQAPSDSTSLSALGGVRYYFHDFSTTVLPYLGAKGGYKNDKDATIASSNTYTESEDSGLVYSGLGGFRFDTDRDFFLEVEVNFFESSLFSTTKKETTAPTGKSKEETTKTEFYVDSFSGIDSLLFIAGMRL